MSESLWPERVPSNRRFGARTGKHETLKVFLILAGLLAIAPACHQPLRRAKDQGKSKPVIEKGSSDKDPSKITCDSKLVALTAITKGEKSARKHTKLAELPPVFVNDSLVHHWVVTSQAPAEAESDEKTLLASVFVSQDSCQVLATLEAPVVELATVKDVTCDLGRPLGDGSSVPNRVVVRAYDDKFPSPYEALYNHKLLEVYGLTVATAKEDPKATEDADAGEPEATVSLMFFQRDDSGCQSFLGRVDRPLQSRRGK